MPKTPPLVVLATLGSEMTRQSDTGCLRGIQAPGSDEPEKVTWTTEGTDCRPIGSPGPPCLPALALPAADAADQVGDLARDLTAQARGDDRRDDDREQQEEHRGTRRQPARLVVVDAPTLRPTLRAPAPPRHEPRGSSWPWAPQDRRSAWPAPTASSHRPRACAK